MPAKDSLPKKRSAKASTRSRSTTSSTTGSTPGTRRPRRNKSPSIDDPDARAAAVTADQATSVISADDGTLSDRASVPLLSAEPVPALTAAQQAAYLTRLAKGASPAAACAALGLSVSAVLTTMDAEAAFRRQLQQIDQLLSQNVAAALYRAAMEGNVSAQTFLLKNRPPPDWQTSADSVDLPQDLSALTDDELDALLRATAATHS